MFTPEHQAIIERGADAKGLLENLSFRRIVDDLTTAHLAAMCACRPGGADRASLDHHHALQYALTEIVDTLQSYVDAATQLEARLEAEANEQED